MRLIDADAFIEELEADAEHIESSIARMMHYAIIKDIEHAPTIDAVEVVRCRDCQYSRDNGDYQDGYYCDNPRHNKMYLVHSGDYCSYGRRKQNEINQ